MTKRVRQGLLALMVGVLLGLLAALLLVRARIAAQPPGEQPPAGTPAAASVPTAPPMPAGTPVPAAAEPSQTPVSPEPDRNEAVAELFRRFAGEHPGRWNLCFLALPDGEPVIWGGEEGPMVSASLIKLPIMGAVYEAIAAGRLDRAQCENWLGPMITVSDNGSANSLVLLLGGGDADKGMAAVNDWCLRQGLTDTRQNRLMLVDNGLQNYTGAADCARLLAAIYRGDCAAAPWSSPAPGAARVPAQRAGRGLPHRAGIAGSQTRRAFFPRFRPRSPFPPLPAFHAFPAWDCPVPC